MDLECSYQVESSYYRGPRYRKLKTVQYIRILNLKLANKMRDISQHFDKVSKISKICLYTLQDNLDQYNHPSKPFYCSSILPSALDFFFVVKIFSFRYASNVSMGLINGISLSIE